MQRNNRKRVRLGLYLKVFAKNGKATEYRRQSLKAFFNILRACPVVKHYFLRVTYFPGISNAGDYYTKGDLMFACRAFTNSKELDFIEKYWS